MTHRSAQGALPAASDDTKPNRMATKAEQFRAAAERSGPRLPSERSRRRAPGLVVDTSRPGVSASARKKGGSSTAARNRAGHAARKASFALEDSLAPKRPSRK